MMICSLTTDVGAIKNFVQQLPEKALDLGVRVLLAVVFLFVGMQVIKLLRKIIKKAMTKADAELGAIQFMDSFLKIALYLVLIMMLASYFGVDAASIVAVLGSAGVAVGLALQGSLSNLAGGVLILILKPFKVGEYIIESATGKEGVVKEIHIFYTRLATGDNKTVILPNGSLANTSIINVSREETRRIDVTVGISYNADLQKAKEVLLEVITSDECTLKDKDLVVYVANLGASSVDMGVRCWVNQEDYWKVMWRVTENCKLALDKNGIEIPFNQLDVHLDGKLQG